MLFAETEQNFSMNRQQMAVVVAGESLLEIFKRAELKEKFIGLVDRAVVVLACRVSPKQKAELVQMIRDRHKDVITLAIGDGANDVNMITAAHVGVGISGLEG